MGFLKKFFRNVVHEQSEPLSSSSFDELTDGQLESHLEVDRYGDFQLTDAVRPSFDLKVVPRQGYRHDTYVDNETKAQVPVLMISASKEDLFEIFMDLLDPLGESIDVVLETSHDRDRSEHTDLYREHIDLPVLKSTFYDFEEMLTDDGCTGIAVLNPGVPMEVQFDEHKLLIVYGSDLSPFEAVLRQHGIRQDDSIKFITEAEHVHATSETFGDEFEQLKTRLGMDPAYV
jgi:hypothetical protein